jgi:hypothetical protein
MITHQGDYRVCNFRDFDKYFERRFGATEGGRSGGYQPVISSYIIISSDMLIFMTNKEGLPYVWQGLQPFRRGKTNNIFLNP